MANKKSQALQASSRFDIEVAFPCDLELNWYLVPKEWVRQIVSSILVAHLAYCIDQFRHTV